MSKKTMSELYEELLTLKQDEDQHVSAFSEHRIAYYRQNPIAFIDNELSFKAHPVMRSTQTDEFLIDMANPANVYAIVCAGRGAGKTFTAAQNATYTATCFPYTEIVVVGGSQEQSRKLYTYVKHFVDNNPRLSNMIEGKTKLSETLFSNGSVIKALACSERKVRAPHPNILFLDEVAAADKAGKSAVIEAAMDSTSGASTKWFPKPRIVMTSTAHHASGIFLKFWLESKQYGFKRYKWATAVVDWENKKVTDSLVPWISVEQIQDALARTSKEQFMVEWQGELKGALSRVFVEADINAAVRPVKQFPIHRNCTRYAGIDWASAKPTIITVIEEYDGKWWILDAISVFSQSITTKANEVRRVWRQYKVEDFYGDAGDQSANSRVAELGVPINPVPFTHQKDLMMGAVKRAFESGLIRIPSNPKSTPLQTLIMQLKMYHYDDKDKFAKGDDDYIDSLALAIYPWRFDLVPDAGTGGALMDIDDFMGNLPGGI